MAGNGWRVGRTGGRGRTCSSGSRAHGWRRGLCRCELGRCSGRKRPEHSVRSADRWRWSGHSTVVWYRFDGTVDRVQARTIDGDGTLGTVKNLSASGQGAFDPQVGVDSSGHSTVVWYRFDGTVNRVHARLIEADGFLGTTHKLSASGQDVAGQQIAVSPNGHVRLSGNKPTTPSSSRWQQNETGTDRGTTLT